MAATFLYVWSGYGAWPSMPVDYRPFTRSSHVSRSGVMTLSNRLPDQPSFLEDDDDVGGRGEMPGKECRNCNCKNSRCLKLYAWLSTVVPVIAKSTWQVLRLLCGVVVLFGVQLHELPEYPRARASASVCYHYDSAEESGGFHSQIVTVQERRWMQVQEVRVHEEVL